MDDSSSGPVSRTILIRGGEGIACPFVASWAREDLPVTRSEWRRIAESRVRDAAALLQARRWSAAYYLAGYAVEYGLKACVVAYLKNHIDMLFRDRRLSEKCWTHDFEELFRLADLTARWNAAIATNPALKKNRDVVKNWRETARYLRTTRAEAEDLDRAITDPADGVLPWIRNHW